MLCLQNNTVLTLLRSLGILCKVITEPYFLKATEVGSILHMSSVYQRLLYVLNAILENQKIVLNTEVSLFYGPCFYDEVYEFLLKTSLNDDLTCVFIKRLCIVLKSKVCKLFSDFLPGGKYFNVSNSDFIVEECKSCDTNNICVERLLGQLDFKLKAGSTSSINSIESCVLYGNNNTDDWLKSKTSDQQERIICKARTENRQFMNKDNFRKEKLIQKQNEILEEKEEDVKRKKERQMSQLDKAIEDMRKVGLWDSEEKIRTEVQKLKTKKEKMDVLKKQLNIYISICK